MTLNKVPVRFTGQHFTIDKTLIYDSVKAAELKKTDTVLDIGAGKGFLTKHLCRHCHKVIAVEKDKKLIQRLRTDFNRIGNVSVIHCDFRHFSVPKDGFKVVSNIPFGITSAILKTLMFENSETFRGGSLIMQSEPAKKLVAEKIFNPYTVFYNTFFALELVYVVDPRCFMPPPTVESALVKIRRKQVSMDPKLKKKYLAFIALLIQKQGKPVRTALKSVFRKKQVRSVSEKHSIDLDAPVEYLSPAQWMNCFLEMTQRVPEKHHPG